MFMKIKSGICLLLILGCFDAVTGRINFGSKQSAFKFADATKFTVPGDLLVDEGTIQRSLTASFDGAPIRFDGGVLAIGAVDNQLTGKYDFDEAYSVILDGNKSFYGNPGITTPKISVIGTGNRLEGDVNFDQANAISFAGAGAALTLALKGGINKNVFLNGGTLTLENVLPLADNVIFAGAGVVKAYGNAIYLNGSDITWPTGTIDWQNVSVIYLNGDVTLQGRWNFHDTCYIIGNGNILDIGIGKLRVMGNSTLYLSDVKLRGLNTVPTYGPNIEFEDKTSRLRLNHAEFEMDTDWTLTTGGFYIENTSTIVTKGRILTFDFGSSCTVDGCVLWYETLSAPDQNNIQPVNSDDLRELRLKLLSGGVVKTVTSSQGGGLNVDNITAPPSDFLSPDGLLRDDPVRIYTLSEFKNITPSKPFNINISAVIDGISNVVSFASTDRGVVKIADGVTLTFENIGLERFKFDHVSLATDASHLVFGDKTNISLLAGNYDLNTTYTFQGRAILNGNKGTLTLGSQGGIMVDTESSLLIQDITIKGVSANQITCFDNTATISFGGNVILVLDDDFVFDKGHFEIMPQGMLDVHGTESFVYQTPKRSFINSGATLQMTDGAIFYYNPSTDNRDLIVFNEEDANLCLYNATLKSTTTGMRLTYGTFQIRGSKNYIENPGASTLSEGIMLGDGLSVENNIAWEYDNGTVKLVSGILGWLNLDDPA